MKTIIFAILFTFTAAGVMTSEAEARPDRRSRAKARNHSNNVRTPQTRVVRKRQPARRSYRQPARRSYRQPARRSYRQPARRSYRQPARRHYRQPARRHYRQPARRYHRPVYRSAVKTVTLTNNQGYTIRVAVRAGNSLICSANPVQVRQFLAPGASLSVSTHGSYVCYRRLPTRHSAGSGWYRAVISARFTRLWF